MSRGRPRVRVRWLIFAALAPSPGGILYRELAPVLRRIAREHRVVGMDVVEVAPSYDAANGITAIMAGRLIVNVLGASWCPGGAMRARTDPRS